MKSAKAIFLDFEVFKYDWLVCITEYWLDENKNIKTKDLVILNNRTQLIDYYRDNKNNGIFIGKNSSRYDNGIMVSIIEGKNPKEVSDKIIEKDISWKMQIKNWRQYNFLYIDIMQDAARISLKEEEAYLDLPIITTEVEFDTNRLLTKEELEKTISYCKADVRALITSFENNIGGIITKLNLILQYDLPKRCISMTNAQLCAKLFDCKPVKFDDEFKPFDISCLGIVPQNKSVLDFYKQEIDYKNKLNIDIAGVPHVYAFGGIHGAIPNFFYDGELWLIDVASYYPSLMIYYNFLSRAMPLEGKRKFISMYFNRRKVKARNGDELQIVIDEEIEFYKEHPYYGEYDSTYNDSLDKEHHKADKKKSQILKLPLNTTYGCEKAKFNDMYDPHNSNNVCIAGQLMLTALVELLEPYSKIIQSNTDGIIIIPEDKDKVREVVSYWEQQSHMTMEIDIAHKLIQKDVNNYILFVDNNNKDTYSLIEDCAKIGVKIEVIDLLKEFKNIYNGISAPVLISVRNGKIIKEESANRDYNVLKSFVTNSQKPVDTYSFNKINVSEYIKLLNSKELTYIYMCSDTSCKEQNRILDDISKTRKFKVNYLNLDEVTTVGDWELLNNSDKIFEDTWFVPVNIVVKNGKIKSYKMEVLDENGLIEFLEDNGM